MRRRLTRGFRHCVGFSVTRCNAPHRNSVGMPPTQVRTCGKIRHGLRNAGGTPLAAANSCVISIVFVTFLSIVKRLRVPCVAVENPHVL